MLFKKEDLALNEAMSILENSEYLSEEESLIDPKTIPVFENARLDLHIVKYNDMIKLAESYGLDGNECVYCIAETNNIDPESIAVALDEADAILDPDSVDDFPKIAINPISEESLAYKFCEACIDAYAESADEDYLWFAIDEGYLLEADAPEAKKQSVWDKMKGYAGSAKDAVMGTKSKLGYLAGQAKKDYADSRDVGEGRRQAGMRAFRNAKVTGSKLLNKKDAAVIGGAAAGVAGAALAARQIYKASKNKPKSWISKKIASLRSLYAKWLRRAKMETNLRRASAIKKVCTQIMTVIDNLMKRLENATA